MTLTHTVLFQFKSDVDLSEIKENGSTHGFVAIFNSAEDRDYYVKSDPAHQVFIAKVGSVLEKATVIDFMDGVF
ncbi:unnamed protein product [Fusarium graminearum]|nr:unnamed protein product [Fusarium graminearum]